MPGIQRYAVSLSILLACIAATQRVAAQACSDQQTACNQYLATNHSTLFNDIDTCSSTELALFGRQVNGQQPGDCLACAFTSGCLDDTFTGNTDVECEDLSGSAAISQCLATLSCDIGVNAGCPTSGSGVAPVWQPETQTGPVNNAFCGRDVSTATCTASGPAGQCAATIKAGYPGTANTGFILNHLTDPTYPSGRANRLAACTLSNCAQECFASSTTSVPALGGRTNGQLGLLALSLLSIGLFVGFGRRSSQV
jgi:hypothetical protein